MCAMKNGRFAEATDYSNRLSDRGKRAATAAQLICRQLINQGNQQDSEIERGFVNEVDGWIDIPDKASCESVSYTHLTLPTKRIV